MVYIIFDHYKSKCKSVTIVTSTMNYDAMFLFPEDLPLVFSRHFLEGHEHWLWN